MGAKKSRHLNQMLWKDFKSICLHPKNNFLFNEVFNIKHKISFFDIYAYALLIKKDKTDYRDDATLKSIYLNNATPISDKIIVPHITLEKMLLTLYYHYDYDISSFMKIYEKQNNLPILLSQVMTNETYRFKEKRYSKGQATFPKFCHLDLNSKIPVIRFTRLLDYLPFPVMVSKPVDRLEIINTEAHNNLNSTILVDNNNLVHDVINIGGTFLDNLPYGNRCQFLSKFKFYDPVEQLPAYNFKQIFENASIIDSSNDVVIKPMGLDYLHSVWTKFNKDSVFSCYMSKNDAELFNRFKKDIVLGSYLRTLDKRTLGQTDLVPTATSTTVDRWRHIITNDRGLFDEFNEYL